MPDALRRIILKPAIFKTGSAILLETVGTGLTPIVVAAEKGLISTVGAVVVVVVEVAPMKIVLLQNEITSTNMVIQTTREMASTTIETHTISVLLKPRSN